MRTGPTNHEYRQVAGYETGDGTPDLDHFAQRFMSDDLVGGTGRRGAIPEIGDLAIGPADPGLQYTQLDLRGARAVRLGVIDDFDFPAGREYG